MADVGAVNLVARHKAPAVLGEPRGIAFVEMTHSTEALAAIDALATKLTVGSVGYKDVHR